MRVANSADWLERARRDAWQTGRDRAADLAEQHRQYYRLPIASPPAKIVYELITDFLGFELHFDPLPLDRYGQTKWKSGKPVITINSLTHRMPGVKHVAGVQHVAALHELMHALDDSDLLVSPLQGALAGLEEPVPIICYREAGRQRRTNPTHREFRAEEGGRAAAISIWALEREPAWREMLKRAADRQDGEVIGGWSLLYACAEAIGVNPPALVKQLTLERRIVRTPAPNGPERIYTPAKFTREGEWE